MEEECKTQIPARVLCSGARDTLNPNRVSSSLVVDVCWVRNLGRYSGLGRYCIHELLILASGLDLIGATEQLELKTHRDPAPGTIGKHNDRLKSWEFRGLFHVQRSPRGENACAMGLHRGVCGTRLLR